VRSLDSTSRFRSTARADVLVGLNPLTLPTGPRFARSLVASALSVVMLSLGAPSVSAQAPPLPPALGEADPVFAPPLPPPGPASVRPVDSLVRPAPPFAPAPNATVSPSGSDPNPPVDIAELLRRLERQESELEQLRRQIEQGRLPTPSVATSNPPGEPVPPSATGVPAFTPPSAGRPAPSGPIDLFASYQSGSPVAGGSASAGSSPSGESKSAGSAKAESKWIDLSTEKWTVKLGGHVQLDYINWATASPQIVPVGATPGAQDYFEFRRLRLVADGTGYGVYDFRLQTTLEPETVGETANVMSPDVKDAYFSINELPLLGRWRIGNFFVPFGLEQVTNDTNNVFLERSIPTQGVFTADREVGMAAYNCTENQRLTWSTGIFFDSITDSLKERIDDNQGYRTSGRLTYLPYYDEASNGRYLVHTGIGVLRTDDQDHRLRVRSRPQIHEGPRLIDSLSLVGNTQTTGNLEGAIVWGAVTLQSEAYLSMLDLAAGNQVVNGQYVHLSYFLTGENRIFERFGQHGPQFGRNAPYSNVFAVRGGRSFGAIEAKARWSRLDLTNVNAGQYNDFTLGFNWYWSDRVRMMFDWIHPFTTADANPFGAVQANILGTRFDFNW
jgi:phosphate-selective porin OprO and OprP